MTDDIAERARLLGQRFENDGYFHRAAAAYRLAAFWYEKSGNGAMRDGMELAEIRVTLKNRVVST